MKKYINKIKANINYSLLLGLALGCAYSIPLYPDAYQSAISDPYCQHLPALKIFTDLVPVSSILEFGCGKGTLYLAEKFSRVSTCEVLTPEVSLEWFEMCQSELSSNPRWNGTVYRAGSALIQANDLARQGYDPAKTDSAFRLEILDLIDSLNVDSYDMVLVDPAIHNRDEFVNCLFNKVDIIAAAATNDSPRCYGWNRIYEPANYQKIEFQQGVGLTFWIKKDRSDVIEKLTGRPPKPSKTGLRVFVAPFHPPMEAMVAKSLNFLDHKILVPHAEFFRSDHPFRIRHTAPVNPHGVIGILQPEGIEVEQVTFVDLQNNPPDIFLISSPDHESDIIRLYQVAQLKNPSCRLVYLLGNNCSSIPFSPTFCNNLISLDVASEEIASQKNIHHVFFMPWIDNDSTLIAPQKWSIPSYLAHHYQYSAFSKGKNLWQQFIKHSQASLGYLDFPLIGFRGPDEVLQSIRESLATIHIKDTEGYGCTILESMARGRPVFLYRSFCQGSRLMKWSIEGETAFFFSSVDELVQKIERVSISQESITKIQERCLQSFHRLCDNQKNALILQNFLDNLR